MAEPIDCSGFCRLCLVKEQVNIPIFEELGDLQQIYLKITACLPIKVSIEDPLPKRICDDCSYKLEQQYQFWNTTLNSEKQLKQWLGIPDEPPPPPPTKSETSSRVKREKDNYETAPKRPRRNARRKAAQNVRQAAAAAIAASDSGPGEDMDMDTFGAKEEHDTDNDLNDSTEPLTESTYMNVGLDSEEATEAGPSGLQKNADAAGNANQDASGTGNPTVYVKNEYTRTEVKTYEDIIKDEDKKTNVILDNSNIESKTQTYNTASDDEDELLYINGEWHYFNPKMETSQQKPPPDYEIVLVNGVALYKCKCCNEIRGTKEQWRRHHYRRTVPNTIPCDMCNKKFKFNCDLRQHKQSAHNPSQAEFLCELCNKTYSTKYTLTFHIERRHLKKNYLKCNLCDKTFYNKSNLQKHVSKVHEKATYPCENCQKVCKTLDAFKVHQRLHDPTFKKFTCSVCDASYLERHSLKKHIKRKHTPTVPIICDKCGKSFGYQHALNRHASVHDNVKNYSCNICEKKFRNKILLRTHVRSHTGEKPFQCNQCEKSFTQRCSLTRHLRYHSGERPYECDLCDKRFVTRAVLNEHKKKHHQVAN